MILINKEGVDLDKFQVLAKKSKGSTKVGVSIYLWKWWPRKKRAYETNKKCHIDQKIDTDILKKLCLIFEKRAFSEKVKY